MKARARLAIVGVAVIIALVMLSPPAPGADGSADRVVPGPETEREPPCGNTQCPNPWDCWTATIVYRELLTPPDINQPPVYRVRQIEFLHEPGNVWQYREDAECHARKAVREGIMRPLNFPENDQRDFIPPGVIEKVRIWKIPMPQ